MKITVMQVNNELASTGVSVYVDGQLLLGQDSALQVSWGLNPPEMIVSHAKK